MALVLISLSAAIARRNHRTILPLSYNSLFFLGFHSFWPIANHTIFFHSTWSRSGTIEGVFWNNLNLYFLFILIELGENSSLVAFLSVMFNENNFCIFVCLVLLLVRNLSFGIGHGLLSLPCKKNRYMSVCLQLCILFECKFHKQTLSSDTVCDTGLNFYSEQMSCTCPRCIPCLFVCLTCIRDIAGFRGRRLGRNGPFESLREDLSVCIDCRYILGVYHGRCSKWRCMAVSWNDPLAYLP